MAREKTQETDYTLMELFDQIDALAVEDYAAALDEILPVVTPNLVNRGQVPIADPVSQLS